MIATIRYVVLNEHTLGYIHSQQPNLMGVLHGSVIRGGHNWLNGPVTIIPSVDQVRAATLEDFEAYRVVPPPAGLPAISSN